MLPAVKVYIWVHNIYRSSFLDLFLVPLIKVILFAGLLHVVVNSFENGAGLVDLLFNVHLQLLLALVGRFDMIVSLVQRLTGNFVSALEFCKVCLDLCTIVLYYGGDFCYLLRFSLWRRIVFIFDCKITTQKYKLAINYRIG